jgi:MFS family permease
MTDQSPPENSTAPKKSEWMDLFRGGLAPYTVLLNLGIALHAIDIFVITTIMPTVVADIGGISFYAWTSMLYMVGTIIGSAAGGYFRARMGTRGGYVWGGLILLVGTVACAIPPDMGTLLAARVVKGIGGGLVIAQSMALISDLYTPTIRTRILALISTTWTVASFFGPGIGGVFAEYDYWRGAFWAQAPFVIAFVAMSWHLIPEKTNSEPHGQLPWRRLLMLAAGVMSVGLTSQYKTPMASAALILLAIFLVWLTFRRDQASETKLFPSNALSIFSPVGLAYWSYFLISITYTTLLIFAPLFLQELHNVTPILLGYLSLVFSTGWTIGSIAVAGLTGMRERTGSVAGMVFAAATTVAFTFAILSGTITMITIWITLVGFGIGVTNVLMTNYGMSVAREGEEGITAAAMPTIRALGVAFGAAAAGLVANSAGLDEGTSRETIYRVAAWVLGFTALIPALAAIVCYRAVGWGWKFRTGR